MTDDKEESTDVENPAKDAPPAIQPDKQHSEKTDKSDKDGEYRYTDWASI